MLNMSLNIQSKIKTEKVCSHKQRDEKSVVASSKISLRELKGTKKGSA